MRDTQKPNKRIVSKGEYAAVQGKRISIGLMGMSVVLLAFLLLHIGCFFGTGHVKYWKGFYGFVMFLWLMFCASHAAKYGRKIIKEAIHTEPGTPLTRANTANLPALDSLVRASSEPVQVQQSVLLRARMEAKEHYAEQLLRGAENGKLP